MSESENRSGLGDVPRIRIQIHGPYYLKEIQNDEDLNTIRDDISRAVWMTSGPVKVIVDLL